MRIKELKMKAYWTSAIMIAAAVPLAAGFLSAAAGNAFVAGELSVRGPSSQLSRHMMAAWLDFGMFVVVNLASSFMATRHVSSGRRFVLVTAKFALSSIVSVLKVAGVSHFREDQNGTSRLILKRDLVPIRTKPPRDVG